MAVDKITSNLVHQLVTFRDRNWQVENELKHCVDKMALHEREIKSLERAKLSLKDYFDERIKEVEDRLTTLEKEPINRMRKTQHRKKSDNSSTRAVTPSDVGIAGVGSDQQDDNDDDEDDDDDDYGDKDDDDDDNDSNEVYYDNKNERDEKMVAGDEKEDDDRDEDEDDDEEEEEEEIDDATDCASIAPLVHGVTPSEGTTCRGGWFSDLFQKRPPSRKKIRKLSVVNAFGNTPYHLAWNVSTKIDGYDRDRFAISPYFDCKTGVYVTPLPGKYCSHVWDDASRVGLVHWVVCDGDGRRQTVPSSWCYGGWNEDGRKLVTGIVYQPVEWECRQGLRLWVEGKAVRSDVTVVKFQWSVSLKE